MVCGCANRGTLSLEWSEAQRPSGANGLLEAQQRCVTPPSALRVCYWESDRVRGKADLLEGASPGNLDALGLLVCLRYVVSTPSQTVVGTLGEGVTR